MGFILNLQPTETRIFRLQYEQTEPVLIEALTFQEAIIAWWANFDDDVKAQLDNLEIEMGGALSGILDFWFIMDDGSGVEDWRQLTLTDITYEHRGIESGNLISCEGVRPMKRPRTIAQQAEKKEAAAAEKKRKLLEQYRELTALMKGLPSVE